MFLNFTPDDAAPAPDGADADDGGCHCPTPDDQYILEIEEGRATLLHAACRKPPPSTWGDWHEFATMGPIPVTVAWERDCDGSMWHGDHRCDCDWWVQVTPQTPADSPERVVICGSTRYTAEMAAIEQLLIWHGVAVFAPTACDLKSPNPLWDDPAERQAGVARLADLHAAMIRDAHWVLVVGPYAGDSTRGEIAHALSLGKTVRFTDPALAAEFDCEVWEPQPAGQVTA